MGLLNVDGYYNPLLALFDKALEEGFLKFSARSIVVSARTPSELLDKLEVLINAMATSWVLIHCAFDELFYCNPSLDRKFMVEVQAYTPIQDRTTPKLCWEDAERLVYAPTVSNTAQWCTICCFNFSQPKILQDNFFYLLKRWTVSIAYLIHMLLQYWRTSGVWEEHRELGDIMPCI